MTSTAITKKPLRQVANVRELLFNDQAKQQLALVSAKHMSPDRMLRLVAGSLRANPKLGECDPLSLLGSLMTCASLGLEPQTPLGHAYLIPFGKKAQLIIGYQGLIALARRSGQIATLHADVATKEEVERGDFDWQHGSQSFLRHKATAPDGQPVYAYAYARMADGGEQFVVLPWSKVESIRDNSEGYKRAVKYGDKTAPWIAHERAMAAKTAIRQLAKFLPMSIEMADALTVDEGQIDSKAFALDPTAGPVIEGESSEAEPEAEAEAPPAEEKPKAAAKGNSDAGKAKPKAEAKAEPKKAKHPAPEPEPEAEDVGAEDQEEAGGEDEALPQAIESVRDRLLADFAEATDGGEIEATLDLFAEQIEMMREAYPAAHAEVMEAADEARERVA